MSKPIPTDLLPSEMAERVAASRAKAMIARGISPREAVVANGTTASSIRRWFGPSWEVRRGSVRPIEDDETVEMLVWTVGGSLLLEVSGSRERLAVYDHRRAVARFIRTGQAADLRALEGATVGGHELETDPDEIEIGWLAGEFDFLELNSGPW